MLEKEYEKLVHYIEGMIEDGCQIVIGGNLIDWDDTNIPELLQMIKDKARNKHLRSDPKLNPGDHLRHRISGQDMWVINDDGKIAFLNPDAPTIKYPLESILNDFEIVKKAE